MKIEFVFYRMAAIPLTLVVLYCQASAASKPSSLSAAPPVLPSPIEFYQGIAAAIEKAQGHVVMDMNGGKYESKVSGTTLRWNVASGTTMEIDFHYENQSLRSSTVVFTPAIHVWLLGSSGFSGKIRRVSYDSNGNITDADIEYDNLASLSPPGNTFGLNRHLELKTRAEDFFIGKPMEQAARIKGCDGNYKNCKPRDIVNRIRFLQSEQNPALLVTLKEGATIYFSKARPDTKATYNNFVKLNSGSGFKFLDLTYELEGGYLRGALEGFRVSVRSGEISAGDLSFNLRDGSVLELNQIKFERDPAAGTAIIEGKYGGMSASVGRGSAIALSLGTANPSTLVLDDGSAVELYGLRYEIDDRRNTRLEVGNGSKIALNLFGGRLAFGPNSYVSLQSGQLNAKFSGVWESGSRPDVSGIIETLDVQISSGELDLNNASRVRLSSGHIRAEAAPGIPGLAINSLHTPLITGQFKAVTFQIAEDSTFRLPGSMTMVTQASGSLTSNEVNSPLRLEAGHNYPLGRFILNLPFKKLSNASQASLALTNGEITLPLENHRDGSIKNIPDRFVEFSGTMNVIAPDGGMVSAPISVTEGVVEIVPGLRQIFKGVWTADLLVGYGFDVDTPFIKDLDTDGDGELNADARIFPLHLRVSLAEALRIRNVPIVFDGNIVKTAVNLNPTLFVQIKKGGGEYKDGDDPNKGTQGGDGFADWQEVFRDDYLTSTVHLYVEPKTYTFKSKLAIDFGSTGLEISLKEIATDESISWTKDGGDLGFVGAVLGGVISFCLTGNPLPGIALGGILGNTVEDRLEGIINVRMAERIHAFRRSWRIQT